MGRVEKLILGLAAVAVCVAIAWFYFPNYAKLKTLRQENDLLARKINLLERENTELEKALKQVGSDPYLYERIARDELGVAKEGELVIDIEE